MKYPTTRFVFDRKKTATRKKESLIQVEVLLDGKKMYVTTGVKVCKHQWNAKTLVYNRLDMYDLNQRITAVKSGIDDYINNLIKEKKPFEWEAFAVFVKTPTGSSETVISYIRRRIDERTDIKETTKKAHRRILSTLEDFGKLSTFSQLTKAVIAEYYEWLMGREITHIDEGGNEVKRKMAQQTVAGYMKVFRTYIHDAILHERIDKDPSIGIKVRRGKSEEGRWLTEKEVDEIYKAAMPTYSLRKVRDLFIFMTETGLAYADMMKFDINKAVKGKDGVYTYTDERLKTGNKFFFVLTDRAMEILEAYGNRLPHITNQQFNIRLKMVADVAHIDKPIATHYARRTCGYRLLNNGMPIEVVSKILGHKSIKTTEATYAKILNDTVLKAYKEHILSKGTRTHIQKKEADTE